MKPFIEPKKNILNNKYPESESVQYNVQKMNATLYILICPPWTKFIVSRTDYSNVRLKYDRHYNACATFASVKKREIEEKDYLVTTPLYERISSVY